MAELFHTERLTVRRIHSGDRDKLLAVYGDAEAMRWVDDGKPLGAEDCDRWITVTLNNYATRGYGMSAIELTDTGTLVGFCGLVHPGGQAEAEIKYALLRTCWGQGFATEVTRGMLAYAARQLGLRDVIATVHPDNAASGRVLLKSGMTDAGLEHFPDGTSHRLFRWYAPAARPGARA